jgi:hypothetical protein
MNEHPQKQSYREIKEGRPKPIFHRIISLVAFSRIRHNLSNMKFFSPCKGLVLVFFVASSARAQLADTIWEGNVTISGFSLTKVQGGVVQAGPNVANASVTLPVEMWFWNNSNCGVVFRRDKWGLNPEEFAWTEWMDEQGNPIDPPEFIYKQGPKYVGGGSLSPIAYNSNGYETTTDSYTYNASKKSGSFSQRTLYNHLTQTHANGATLSIAGKFHLSNPNTLVSQNLVLSLTPNPFGPNSYRIGGSLKLRAGNFSKTTRKPSVEKDAEPGFRSFYYAK